MTNFVHWIKAKLASFREMLCEQIHNGHLYDRDSITKLGYNTTQMVWEFAVICIRCNKVSLIDRLSLNQKLLEDYGKPDKPESPTTAE